MSNIRTITTKNWEQRVYRVASKLETMGDATTFCRENNVLPNPSLMVKMNPDIKRKNR